MIYRILKCTHPVSLTLAAIAFMVYASIDDKYTLMLHTAAPDYVNALALCGVILMIPTVMFAILDYIKVNIINRKGVKKWTN